MIITDDKVQFWAGVIFIGLALGCRWTARNARMTEAKVMANLFSNSDPNARHDKQFHDRQDSVGRVHAAVS
jgi:hypothetical protein